MCALGCWWGEKITVLQGSSYFIPPNIIIFYIWSAHRRLYHALIWGGVWYVSTILFKFCVRSFGSHLHGSIWRSLQAFPHLYWHDHSWHRNLESSGKWWWQKRVTVEEFDEEAVRCRGTVESESLGPTGLGALLFHRVPRLSLTHRRSPICHRFLSLPPSTECCWGAGPAYVRGQRYQWLVFNSLPE